MAFLPLGCDDDLKAVNKSLCHIGWPNLAIVECLSMPQQVRQLGDVRSDLPRVVAREQLR
jgi:hypothetical protein